MKSAALHSSHVLQALGLEVPRASRPLTTFEGVCSASVPSMLGGILGLPVPVKLALQLS